MRDRHILRSTGNWYFQRRICRFRNRSCKSRDVNGREIKDVRAFLCWLSVWRYTQQRRHVPDFCSRYWHCGCRCWYGGRHSILHDNNYELRTYPRIVYEISGSTLPHTFDRIADCIVSGQSWQSVCKIDFGCYRAVHRSCRHSTILLAYRLAPLPFTNKKRSIALTRS